MEKNVGSFVDFFERLITDFSWRRLGLIAAFLVMVGAGLAVYELYTQSFKLQRLDREAALIERVLALDKAAQATTDAQIRASLDSLKSRVKELDAPEPGGPLLNRAWMKAMYTALPWVALVLIMMLSPGGGVATAAAGTALVAVPLIVLNANLPDFDPLWVNHWLIPWGELAVVLILIMLWQGRKKK
jgi:hypothetical protein